VAWKFLGHPSLCSHRLRDEHHLADEILCPNGAGTGNVFVSSLEPVGSIIAALSMIAPIVCLVLIALLCIFVIWKAGRLFIGRIKIK
jgi:hypothetical protein